MMLSDVFSIAMEFLRENEFASGGLVIGAATGVLYSIRSLPGKLWALLRRRIMFEVEVLDTDEAYNWLMLWVATKTSRRWNRRVTAVTSGAGALFRAQGSMSYQGEDDRRAIRLIPAPGTHLVMHRGSPVLALRSRDDDSKSMMSDRLLRPESLTLVIFRGGRGAALEIIEEARCLAQPNQDINIRVMAFEWGCWSTTHRLRRRPADSVVLANHAQDVIVEDLRRFIGSEDWYAERCIPWRRGYLLHGPPGNGKTSLIQAMAAEAGQDIGILRLADKDMTDARLAEAVATSRDNGLILVIEDVDAAFGPDREKGEKGSQLTFSGLINAIDGLNSPGGQIVVMTTNHPDRLDEALFRPGRVDVTLEIGNATPDQARRIALRFGLTADEASDFATMVREGEPRSMASLQAELLAMSSKPGRRPRKSPGPELIESLRVLADDLGRGGDG